MRNHKRIKPILKEIEKIWLKNENLRLGQLIGNCVDETQIYYIEDDDLIELLKQTYQKFNVHKSEHTFIKVNIRGQCIE